MSDPLEPLRPAFYARRSGSGSRRLSDWWLVLHPPYTLWHLTYVAIGATISPRFDGGRLAATLFAFFLGVGVAAHALDELHGRPLKTAIPGWLLVAAAATSLTGAGALGVIGIGRVGGGLAVFIVVGIVLTCAYNLELFGGRLHNDVTFAAAWGAFPVLTAYYAQTATIRFPAVAGAVAAYWLSRAQRSLSRPARDLRRRVAATDGTITYRNGTRIPLSTTALLEPLETALTMMSYAVVALAVALVAYRLSTR